MARSRVPAGYSLVICEKPDVARRVSGALAFGSVEMLQVGRVPALHLKARDGRRYVVCSAAGHLYGISDTVNERTVYPALDMEWFPLDEVGGKPKQVVGRISAIRRLSEGAAAFVNACDFDAEGETIGYNILRYACGGKEDAALRAKFSDLTAEAIVEAFARAETGKTGGLARAGRLRHTIDFAWGVNLSRALTGSSMDGRGFRVVSIGRVQGPTLKFAVERHVEVMAFVPTPFWTVDARFRRDGAAFAARYSASPVATRGDAQEVKGGCEGREGVVSACSRTRAVRRPPPPFDLGELQKEAFRSLAYSPSRTLRIAERLYLGAMISYPRTESQKLPRLDYRRLLSRLGEIPGYSGLVGEILSQGRLEPVEGRRTDSAHPAIYPTGHFGRLRTDEKRLFDLVVRRFLSCFAGDEVVEVARAEVVVAGREFVAEESSVLERGWTRFASDHQRAGGAPVVLGLSQGDRVILDEVSVEERLGRGPPRYNESSLVGRMERERIGTKATRGDTVSTLMERGYLERGSLAPTELGLSLVEAMNEYCPQILSTELTRRVEAHLEAMEKSDGSSEGLFEEALTELLSQVFEVRRHEAQIAQLVRGPSVSRDDGRRVVLGPCPSCKEGRLWVVRSRSSGKRFVGCSNFASGCRASSPLPQRGTLSPLPDPCGGCGWPVIRVRSGSRDWKLCVNDRCPRKVNVYSMRRRGGRS